MKTKILSIARKFHSYQKERFPIIILGISLLPAVLSSGAIVSAHPTIMQMALALIASVAYLLHIRVIDEHRDFGHDNVHHVARPIQAGVISKEELRLVDISAVALLIIIAAVSGFLPFLIALIMLAYSYLAGKEFFAGERIRNHFFIYNGANLLQMLLMQIFVYAIFASPIPLSPLVFTHFFFTTIGTIVFEFVRKLKIPGDDGTGKDTYTWYLGFNNAIYVYSILVGLNATLFFWIAIHLSSHIIGLLIFALCLAGLAYSSVAAHWIKRSRQTDQLMQLAFLVMYGIFNLIIFFLAR